MLHTSAARRWPLVALALLAWGCSPPSWRHDRFSVEGEFRADGSCWVELDGEPAIPQPARTRLTRLGVDSEEGSREVLTAACEQVEGYSHNLFLFLYGPGGDLAGVGTYRVTLPLPSPPADTRTAYASLDHPKFMDDGMLGAYLQSLEGWVAVQTVDSARIVGRFRFVARRRARAL